MAQHPTLSNTQNPVVPAAAINSPESPLSGQLMFSYENSTQAWTLQTASAGWRARLFPIRVAAPDSKKALLTTGGTKETRTGGNSTDPFVVINENLAHSEAAGLKSLIQNTLHAFSYNEATGDWYAHNAANRITFMYTRDGTAKFSEGENAFGLTLLGIGRGDGHSPAGNGHVQADGRQLNITRPEYTEWYRNNDEGVEQGITIASRPTGSGLLHVGFGLTGNNSLSLKDTKTLILNDASGTPLFEYTGLRAFSSDGRDLPASLATDGTTLSWVVDDTGAVYPVTIDPVVVSALKANATFTGGGGNSAFGYSVALSSDGNTALVGAYINSTGASNAGAAYIFVAPGGVWSGTTSASAANATFTGGAANDYVGLSVALSSDGSTALIGAGRNSTNGKSQNGAAYLFTKPGTGWSGTIPLSAALPNFTGVGESDQFGYSSSLALSSDGSTALVGAWWNTTAGMSKVGTAYIFKKPGGGWPVTTTSASAADATFTGGKASDNFGFSVALSSDGNTALVGAWNNGTADMSTNGAAYIFVAPGGVWSGTTSASAANATFAGGANSDQFGSAVALSSDGSTALVGAWKNSTAFYQAGAAYIFVAPGGVWSGTTSASAANATFTGGAMQDYFGNGYGNSVALSSDGSTALVGAYYNKSRAGAAYIFKKPNGGVWSGTTSASAATENFQGATGSNYFGYSVALNSTGTMALIGAYGNYTGGSQTGSAYIFGPPPYVTLTAGGTTTGTAGTVVNGLTLNPTDTLTNVDLFLGTDATTISGTAIKTGISSLSGSTATTVNSVDLTGKTAGTYYLIVNSTGTTTILGATSSAVYTVTGGTPPVAGFTSVNVSVVTNSTAQGWAGVNPFTMQFTDTSTNTPTSWKWARNNLTDTTWTVFNTSQNARDSFWTGNWSVNLTATNSGGSGISGITWVNVSTSAATPVASFTGTPLTGTAPLAVTFTDTSTGSPTTWNWVFGDGNTSTIQSPAFTYVTSGYFTVKLNATNAFGSNTKTASQYISVAAASRQNSTANANITQTTSGGQINVNVSTCDPGMTVTNTTTQVVVTNPALGWQKYTFDGANVTKNTCYTNISVSNVTMDSTSFTAPLPDLGTVSTSLIIGQNQSTSGTLQQEIIAGANSTVTNAFQLAATNSGLTLGNIAYTLQIGGAAPFNTNLTTSGVIINMSASHTWVLANGGTGAIKIFRYSDTGVVQMLPTTFVGTDAGSIDYFLVTSVNGFSEFGLGGTSSTSSGSSSSGGDGGSMPQQSGQSGSGVAIANEASAGQTVMYSFGNPSATYPVSIQSVSLVPNAAIPQSQCVVQQQGPSSAFGLTDRPAAYESIEINWINPEVVTSGTIHFSVLGTWLREKNIDPANVVLLRSHDLVWTQLPTTFDHQSGDVHYYSATTPGFSYFAVSVRKNVTAVGVVNGTTIPAPSPAMINTAATTMTTKSTLSSTTAQRTSPTPTPAPAPAAGNNPGFAIPLLAVTAIIILAVGGFLVRRWWIRRQNPVLFRDYD